MNSKLIRKYTITALLATRILLSVAGVKLQDFIFYYEK